MAGADNRNQIVIIGSGGHAKVVADILEKQNQVKIVGFIDDNKPRGTFEYGYEVIGDQSYLVQNLHLFDGGIVAIGDNWIRSKVVANVIRHIPDFHFITAVHPSAIIARGVQLGLGTVVMAAAVINSDTVIGNHCIINTSSSVDHDCIFGDFVNLAPGAATGGNVKIGDYTTLSLGANIIHSIQIGEHTVIGAGSNVVTDIGSLQVAYGSPAKVVRQRQQGEKYL